MTLLLAYLAPIALIDSLSVLPLALIALLSALGSRRPAAASLSFLAGMFLSYFLIGVLLLFGLDALFDSLAAHFTAWWNREPHFGELILELIVGVLMIVYGFWLCGCGKEKDSAGVEEKTRQGVSPVSAFIIAVLMNITGAWGALPYFAAAAQILKMDLSLTAMFWALLFYNLIYILPLAAIPLSRLLLGASFEPVLAKVNDFIVHWSRRILITLLLGLGFLMIADGIGWFVGMPLLAPG